MVQLVLVKKGVFSEKVLLLSYRSAPTVLEKQYYFYYTSHEVSNVCVLFKLLKIIHCLH